ncbi:uncharacterized protein L3040_009270 [Drepanopeziza brunnea f. sp. 'multigermtubi']|uniref:Beta-lactamase superfamily domain-containing protein n=1 Tax=Marssonina brunnea f. sp. multigermtubi (strain MB_m1) TaxID=1072389 RepID=K1WNP1_MARBU|nr:uncharacterized protein MBM_02527 [Drepanopeziza brunnea f. sp. 'multigermtubi' MB_m1]EKD19290.1 hypothetical protein MBM_02527 [Drepanopeziza brunnea f. sp. 'multigermtubi' MB_m1]KAJ5032675.1 hypothetical protein L3040_009270 [Drepanopeziza brunnea f. sp. 'multigermtubi']
MSLTIKHLNSDASFLLTFQPIPCCPPCPDQQANSFKILLDPWLSGPSKVLNSRFSIVRHKFDACVRSLNELDEVDLVVISQSKSDHCHKETLTQLPRTGGKTLILAEPAAAKLIRGWNYFAPEKVITLPKFEESRPCKRSAIYRIPIPSAYRDGRPGEVTIASLAQKADLTRLHSAIGITYLPPVDEQVHEMTPPAAPSSSISHTTGDRALSLIHAPHGISYKTLRPYARSHLIPQEAFPLTALLHCFHRIQNSWYLGGNICSGLPGGIEVAQKLRAQVWISAHDGEKDVRGLANRNLVVQRFEREEVEKEVSPRGDKFPNSSGTEAVVLGVGEEMYLVHLPGNDDEYKRSYIGCTPIHVGIGENVAAGFRKNVARAQPHNLKCYNPRNSLVQQHLLC